MNLGRMNLGVGHDRLALAPAQIAVSLCVLLALICLGASLLVPQPLELRQVTPATLLPLLGGLLGLAAGVLGLHASQSKPVAPVVRALFAAPTADVATLLNDLRALLAEERHQAAAMREQCATTGNEALLVGARLAGAALDAEQRLAASVGLAEQALQNPGGALARAAAATRRVERAIGELTDLIKAGPGAVADGPDQAAAAGDTAAAQAVIALRGEADALRTTAAEAAIQVAEALMHAARSTDQLLGGLPGLTAGLAEGADALRGEAAALGGMAARLEAVTPGLDRVEAVGLRLGRLTENLPAAIENLVAAVPAALARMASEPPRSLEQLMAIATDLQQTARSLEMSGHRQNRAAEALAAAVAQVHAAVAGMGVDEAAEAGGQGKEAVLF